MKFPEESSSVKFPFVRLEDDTTDVNQNILCNKRNIDQVDSSSERDDDEEPSANNGGEMNVEVTHPPTSHNCSFQDEVLLTSDNVGKIVNRELLNAFKGNI